MSIIIMNTVNEIMFILRKTAVYAVWYIYMHRREQSSACKTYHRAYTAVSLRMNPRSSKQVGDNRH